MSVDRCVRASARETLAKRPSFTRRELAEDSRDAAVLQTLAREEDDGMRRNVAGNWNTPAEALEELADNADERVQRAAANNPNTTAETLATLVTDEDWNVRRVASANAAREFVSQIKAKG